MPEKAHPLAESGDKETWLKELGSQKTRESILRHIFYLKMRLSRAEVEDITQQTMFKAVRAVKAGQFKKSSTEFTTWLKRIATNTALDLLRRKKFTDRTVPLADAYKVASNDPTSEEKYAGVETTKRLSAHFKDLSPELREVLELRAEGLDLKQIAERLKVNLNTIKSRQRYAVERLRKRMEEEEK